MATIILPLTNLFHIASEPETEAGKLKAGIELMNGVLQFSYIDAEQADGRRASYFF